MGYKGLVLWNSPWDRNTYLYTRFCGVCERQYPIHDPYGQRALGPLHSICCVVASQEVIRMPHRLATARVVPMVISVPRAVVSRGRALVELTAVELSNMHETIAPCAQLDLSVAWALKNPRTAREGRMVTALA